MTEYLTYARAYGGQQPEPFCVPSVANLTKFYNTAAKLASGEGITCNYRGGAFDEGVEYTPTIDVDDCQLRARKWLPMAKDKSTTPTAKYSRAHSATGKRKALAFLKTASVHAT